MNKFTEIQIQEMANLIKEKYFRQERNCDYKTYDENVEFYKIIYPEKKVVYIKQDNFNRVKIGVSNNSESRNKQLSDSSGLFITDIYDSEYCTNWSTIEANMHRIFKTKRIKGEWFDINPKDAIKELKKQVFKDDKIVKSLYKLSFKKVERLYKIIKSGRFHGLELEEDNQPMLNCSEKELKEKIIYEIKDISENYQEKTSKLDKFQDIEDELYYYVKMYFSIFDTNNIVFKNFTIENDGTYDMWAYLNDNSYGERLCMFAIAMGEFVN